MRPWPRRIRIQGVPARTFLQVHDATAGPEGKFGITLVLDDRTQVVNDNVVDYGRAGKELLQVTLAAPLASRQIVGRLGRVFVRGIVAMMRGHMGKAVEDVDRIGVVYHLHAFAHILYRHAVVVLVQRDVTVALDCGNRPLSHLIAVRGQRP